ncbi:MAG: ribonuclease PH [Rickettsiales endosymbiont of Dermacentor nuttalli]
MRLTGRLATEIRSASIEPNFYAHAEGSCLIKMGNTHVICSASLDENIPPFLRGKNKGWITAEYSMLPGSTQSRTRREAVLGKQSGRTQEIQRLIGRVLRSVVKLDQLGERQIIVDCDVIQADGGTRTACITGGYVALYLALKKMHNMRLICSIPIIEEIAAISCGVYAGQVITDLDYQEDSNADVDANFVMTASRRLVEIQGTAENHPFTEETLYKMLALAKDSIGQLINIQREAINNGIKK